MQKNFIFVFCCLLLFNNTLTHCGSNQVMIVEDGEVQCKSCPNNCEKCYQTPEKELKCLICQDGFFITPVKKICKACYENCTNCSGPTLDECSEIKQGYFYNAQENSIQQCNDEGCFHCSSQNECNSCKRGFMNQQIQTGLEKDDIQKILTCKKCKTDNCALCIEQKDNVKNTNYEVCKHCISNYVLNGEHQCISCPDNCTFCSSGSAKCILCSKGYQLDQEKNQCKKIEINHCFKVNDDGTCKHCETNFLLENNQCTHCSLKFDNCSYCKYIKEESKCIKCLVGYQLVNNTCVKCTDDNCRQCNSDKCIACKERFYLTPNENKCKKCTIKDCIKCASSDKCFTCKDGTYFNKQTKTCEKCANNCLECTQDGQNCLSCPIKYFTLSEKIISSQSEQDEGDSTDNEQLPNILKMLFGDFIKKMNVKITTIKMVNKCVEKCPEEIEGKKVVTDLSKRRCVVNLGDSLPSLLQDKPEDIKNDPISSLELLRVKYSQEIMSIKAKALLQPQDNKDKGLNLSEECFYHGELHKEFSGVQDSYYLCKCQDGYKGDNCQISKQILDDVSKNLIDIIDQLEKEFIDHDKHSQQVLLKSLTIMNKFKLNEQIMKKVIYLLKHTLAQNKEMDNQQELYMLYDSMLLNLFDLVEDLKKDTGSGYGQYDVDYQRNMKSIYEDIHDVIKLMEESLEDMDFTTSFLEKATQKFLTFDTFSYVMAEFRLMQLKEVSNFMVRNPSIDTSSSVVGPNQVSFDLTNDVNNNQYNVQLINFSASLFKDKFEEQFVLPVSNLMYVKLIDPKFTKSIIYNSQAGISSLRIKFTLLYLPASVRASKKVECRAFSFYTQKRNLYGELKEFNEDNETVVCEFDGSYNFSNYYFLITDSKQF